MATLMAGCSAVLGMDAPTLDPCATQGSCIDATEGLDALPPEAAPDTGPPQDADAAQVCLDTLPDDAAAGVLCGGGCYPFTYCTGGAPICCVSTDDAGVTTYACTASESTCAGFPFHCINENDCPGSDVCCRLSSHMVCDLPANCPGGQLGCVPGSSQDCPTGKPCNVPLVVDGATTPYSLCQP
jgi:hypothetical protein